MVAKMREQIDELFNKEMTRKEFLQHVGSALLIAFGITGLINAFQPRQTRQTAGYGSSAYGGGRRQA